MVAVLETRREIGLRRSGEIYEEAKIYIPSGASSTIRVYKHEPHPVIFARGKGSRVWDVDGNGYIDYLLAYGALILGHTPLPVIEAVKEQLEKGTMFGTTTELEVEVAKLISSMVPNAEMVLFTNTGTEATMEAIRIARAHTGKDKVVKFEGHYHGHHDYVLFSVDVPLSVAGLESSPSRLPYYPGIPEEVAHTVLITLWNNQASVEKVFKKHGNDIAAIIAEPVMGSSGVIPPERDFLKFLKEVAERYDALLIFDEVLTGFRIAKGGAQEYYGARADIATFAKALGGGFPIAAITGRRDILENVGPGKIGYGGTYNANPVSLAAAKATLTELAKNDGEVYHKLNHLGEKLKVGLEDALSASGHDGIVQGVGPILQLYFTRLKKIRNYRQAVQSDLDKFRTFQRLMLERGVYFHPDGMERLLISAAHTADDVDRSIEAAEDALKELAPAG